MKNEKEGAGKYSMIGVIKYWFLNVHPQKAAFIYILFFDKRKFLLFIVPRWRGKYLEHKHFSIGGGL
jgi:hypothetical protein